MIITAFKEFKDLVESIKFYSGIETPTAKQKRVLCILIARMETAVAANPKFAAMARYAAKQASVEELTLCS